MPKAKKKAPAKAAGTKKKAIKQPVSKAAKTRKSAPAKSAKVVASKAAAKTKTPSSRKPASPAAKVPATDTGRLAFNHAMLYVKDVARAIDFYRSMLGFQLIEDFRHEGISVYARLKAPGNDGTIALHLAGPGVSVASDGMRLYFEVGELDDFCHKLQKRGFYFTQLPRVMPWGWRHAYLNDPDGHEISVYWAGENRMKKTIMQAAKQVAKS